MKALKIIGIIFLVIILIIVGYGMTLSGESRIERSIVINSPANKVYREVNTFNNILEWSPWTKIDLETKYQHSGPEYGVGAKYTWESDNQDVGSGSQEIIESKENEYVKTRMDFGIEGDFYAEFILEPVAGGTNLTWTYEGKVESLLWKYLLLGMDGQLGPMYEQGLADLKTYIERLPDYAITISELEAEAISYIGIRVPMPTNTEEIGPKMGQLYGLLEAFMEQNSIARAGMPMTVYYINDDGSMDMEVAMPTATLVENTSMNIIAKITPASIVLKGIHMGDYNNLHSSYEEILKYAEDNNYEQAAAMYEIYITDPGEVDTANWQTDIYIPIRKKTS